MNDINIFEVGGSIRDELLGVKSADKDFCVEAPSFEAMREKILSMGGKIFLETPAHFTIRAMVPNLGASDFVLCRKEGPYSDGRHPDWVSVGTLADDLARRDFTMNAIARNSATGEIIDPRGVGRADIFRRVVSCVGESRKRFVEDRLRVFRAVRFAVQKNFSIHPETRAAMLEFSDGDFSSVSTERIRAELLKMFAANSWCAVSMLEEFNLIPLIESRGIWLKPTTEGK